MHLPFCKLKRFGKKLTAMNEPIGISFCHSGQSSNATRLRECRDSSGSASRWCVASYTCTSSMVFVSTCYCKSMKNYVLLLVGYKALPVRAKPRRCFSASTWRVDTDGQASREDEESSPKDPIRDRQ